MVFIFGWMFVVYFPLAHMVWGIDGFMNGVWNAEGDDQGDRLRGRHRRAHVVGLVGAGSLPHPRQAQGLRHEPFYPAQPRADDGRHRHALGRLVRVQRRQRVAADGIAANAFTATTLATAVATMVWPALEWVTRGKPTVLGFCSGAVAGLVVITPASGFVTATGAVIIGVLAGAVPFFACTKLKAMFDYDDALDTFGVHGVGGTLGALVTGFFATDEANANLTTNLSGIVGHTLWLEQLKAMGLTIALAVTGTVVLGLLVRATIGLRPGADREEEGLDQTDHGEAGYHLDQAGG